MSQVEGFGHAGFTVENLEEASASFVHGFGFERGAQVHLEPRFASAVTGVPGAEIKVQFVHGPGDLAVELLEYVGPEDRQRVEHRTCDTGSAHIALYVRDLEAALEQAGSSGWHLKGEIVEILAGPRAGGRAAYLTDSNGIVVEVVQRPTVRPAKK